MQSKTRRRELAHKLPTPTIFLSFLKSFLGGEHSTHLLVYKKADMAPWARHPTSFLELSYTTLQGATTRDKRMDNANTKEYTLALVQF